MKQTNKNAPGLWLSATAAIVLLLLAVWQFYTFATFKNVTGAVDLQGGKLHLWMAVAAALLGAITGFFVVTALRQNDSSRELHITDLPRR
ncbi:MAG TPA: hypothetical protein VI306_10955 [Pyrinomonadaceae bacterium]